MKPTGSYKLRKIPPDLLEAYVTRQITSFELADKTGMNASYLRRAVPRNPKEPPINKSKLLEARKQFRASIAHKSATEIASLAHVSLRTAQRIRSKAAKLQDEATSDSNEAH